LGEVAESVGDAMAGLVVYEEVLAELGFAGGGHSLRVDEMRNTESPEDGRGGHRGGRLRA
jgi:hypothetical protein